MLWTKEISDRINTAVLQATNAADQFVAGHPEAKVEITDPYYAMTLKVDSKGEALCSIKASLVFTGGKGQVRE